MHLIIFTLGCAILGFKYGAALGVGLWCVLVSATQAVIDTIKYK